MIFIFNGPPGSGKDEACLYFRQLGLTHISFKNQLIKETVKYYGVSLDWFLENYNDRKIKERPEMSLAGLSRREALIHVSEDILKPKYGNDFFGSIAASSMSNDIDYCFSDGGFKEELIPIINKFGAESIIIVQLTRDGCDFSSDSRRYINGHLVEEYILGKETRISNIHMIKEIFPINTYRVHNNSTVQMFRAVLKQIHEKERNARKINQEKGSGAG